MLPAKALQFSSQSTRYPTTCAFYTTHTVQILRWGANKVRIFCWFWIPSRTNIGWAGGGSQRVESGWGEIKNKGNPHEFMKHGKPGYESNWRVSDGICLRSAHRRARERKNPISSIFATLNPRRLYQFSWELDSISFGSLQHVHFVNLLFILELSRRLFAVILLFFSQRSTVMREFPRMRWKEEGELNIQQAHKIMMSNPDQLWTH